MADSAFAVAYDGPAVTDGTMPVRDLAPALLALGDLFTDASTLIYPNREPVALNIKATDQRSFLVHLILESKRTWDQVIDIFGSDGMTALLNPESRHWIWRGLALADRATQTSQRRGMAPSWPSG